MTFTSTVTLYNPNGSDVTVGLDFFDANNNAVPGPKPCSDVLVPANGTVAFTLASQCTLDPTTSHFGPLIASDNAATSQIFGYSRTENSASAGFSIEGFPSENFATDTTNVTGLEGSTNVAPTHQSNCFVTAQADAITYDMNLFDGTTGAQIGSTVSGSLNPFEQFRYLDVFSPTVANAPAATDFSDVRAEFTRTSGGTQQVVAFYTVQDNATFGADFRIAKAVTPPPPPPPPQWANSSWRARGTARFPRSWSARRALSWRRRPRSCLPRPAASVHTVAAGSRAIRPAAPAH